MRGKKLTTTLCAGMLMSPLLFPAVQTDAKEVMVDSKVLEQLQQLVTNQQQQLDRLQKQVDQFQQTAVAAQTQAQEAQKVAQEVKTMAESTEQEKTVTSGQERIKLAVSGQVNRALNVIDDEDKTDVYFVDNDASNSKLRLVGTAEINEDLTLGSRLEIAFAPNESSEVNQNDQESGDFIDERYADLTLASKMYGKVYFGKGDTASNNSAEVDLSGTDVVQYASIADIAGGMFFRDSQTNELRETTVSDAFKDFDGLSRKNRLRYDLPTFYGFGLAGSVISDRRWDTALTWAGAGYGFKVGAAAAVAYLNEDNSDYQYDGSLSILHEDSGLSFTVSTGTKDVDTVMYNDQRVVTADDDPYNMYGKLGWQTKFFPFGKTAFGVDYGHTENLPEDGSKGDSFGVAAVQSFADYGTELYFQFRQYSLDLKGADDVSDINVATVGARVKF